MLIADIDATCRTAGLVLDRTERLVAQLHPERARSCQIAVALTRVALDEVRLRAHARPLDEPS